MDPMSTSTWQKSSFSSGDGNTNCVEVAVGESALGLRESDEPGTVLSPQPAALRALLAHLRSDRDPIR